VTEDFSHLAGTVAAGDQIAGYQLGEQIGTGGMAVVYRALDLRLGRQVALKVLAARLAEDDAFRQRFIRESRAAAGVDHPHIIPVYEAGDADGVLFIAMRYVSAGDVRTLIQAQGMLSPARASAITSQAASALDAAHAHGLVHRDVKPGNILLDAVGGRDHVYLADFGLSKHSLNTTTLTAAGQFMGTLDYVSPEQIQGRPADGRADQYALACTAVEMLSGTPPYKRDESMALLWAQLEAPPPLLTDLRPDLPPEINTVISTALAKSPADRFPTCLAFASALAAVCEARPAVLREPTELAAALPQQAAPPAGGAPAGAAAAAAPRPAPSNAAPPADAPPARVPAAGIPAAGIPAAGGPAAGIPAAGAPAADAPAAGVPAAGVPGWSSQTRPEPVLAGLEAIEETAAAPPRQPAAFASPREPAAAPAGAGVLPPWPAAAAPGIADPPRQRPGEADGPGRARPASRQSPDWPPADARQAPGWPPADARQAPGWPPADARQAPGPLQPLTSPQRDSHLVPQRQRATRAAGRRITAVVLGAAIVVGLGFAGYKLLDRPARTGALPPVYVTKTVPPSPATGTSPTPSDTVQAYFAAINARHYRRAWQLNTVVHSNEDYQQFVSGLAGTSQDTVTIQSTTGNVVSAQLVAQQTNGKVKTFQGTYTVTNGIISASSVRQVS